MKTYTYNWANNDKRLTLKNRLCRILAVGKKYSCLVEFENGQKEIISRRALKSVTAQVSGLTSQA